MHLTLWFLTIGTAVVGFFVNLRQKRNLRFPSSFLGYVALAGIIQIMLALVSPKNYAIAYWVFELLNNLMLCALAVEIIRDLLPSHLVLPWAISFTVILGVGFYNGLPSTTVHVLLNLSISAIFTGGLLLVPLFFIKVNWTTEHKRAAAGVIALLLADLFPSLLWKYKGPNSWLIPPFQVGPIIGLILLAIAGTKRPKK